MLKKRCWSIECSSQNGMLLPSFSFLALSSANQRAPAIAIATPSSPPSIRISVAIWSTASSSRPTAADRARG